MANTNDQNNNASKMKSGKSSLEKITPTNKDFEKSKLGNNNTTNKFNLEVVNDYDLSFDSANQEEETFTIIGDNVSSALSVTNSENIYTVELNTYDENGNSVEVYYNGNISIYNGN